MPTIEELPLNAIMRGLPPDDAAGIGKALIGAGIRMLEVTMNSPCPLKSLAKLVDQLASMP